MSWSLPRGQGPTATVKTDAGQAICQVDTLLGFALEEESLLLALPGAVRCAFKLWSTLSPAIKMKQGKLEASAVESFTERRRSRDCSSRSSLAPQDVKQTTCTSF